MSKIEEMPYIQLVRTAEEREIRTGNGLTILDSLGVVASSSKHEKAIAWLQGAWVTIQILSYVVA